MNSLIIQAIKKADQIRTQLGLNMSEPMDIFNSCYKLGINVRFLNINMEGMYISHEDPTKSNILISNLRPLPRRIYTCAHELGHHVFGHGSKIDNLTDDERKEASYDDEEFLVDVFAGMLLMPIFGVQLEFAKRGWKPNNANPLQFYIIACIFGTGYSALITHCKMNRLIDNIKAKELLKTQPGKILESILGKAVVKSHFKFIDEYSPVSVIDLEVTNLLILPKGFRVEGTHIEKHLETDYGAVYIAKHPGIVRAISFDYSRSYFIRIQNFEYVGLAENRHLET